MNVGPSIGLFFGGAAVSLITSWILVSRLERVGERLGLSEALLGMVAALAADMPEITSAVTALVHHQQSIGAGVVLGSNVFNMAALLGLGAVVSGRIVLHRRVVVLGGVVALLVGLIGFLTVEGECGAGEGLFLVIAVMAPYTALLGGHRWLARRNQMPGRVRRWLLTAVSEEELELAEAIRPRRATASDAVTVVATLATVVLASVVMERAASSVGTHFRIPEIVVGGIVLAAITSLPNAVGGVYLARRGRGAASLSVTLNSNSINVLAGYLIPATVIGLTKSSESSVLVAGWYVGLMALMLVLCYAGRGLRRTSGAIIIVAYVLFMAALLVTN